MNPEKENSASDNEIEGSKSAMKRELFIRNLADEIGKVIREQHITTSGRKKGMPSSTPLTF
jgi:hypothetical protein